MTTGTSATPESIDPAQAGGATSLFWNGAGIMTRQVILMLSAVFLARVLGPSEYAVVALIAVFVAFTSLVLDQGMSSSLVSSQNLTPEKTGAAATLNLILAALMAAGMSALAGVLASVMSTPDVEPALYALSAGLVFKALAVVPRAILARQLRFQNIAYVDIAGSVVGLLGLAGLLVGGAGYWAYIAQVVLADAVIATAMLLSVRPALPNMRFKSLGQDLDFGRNVLLSNLSTYVVQNFDNVLIAKLLGPQSLSFYSISYRVVTTPVQVVGQIVSRVLFPLIARNERAGRSSQSVVTRALQGVSLMVVPAMVLVAVAAGDLVQVVLGDSWQPASATLAVFAIAGARQSLTTMNTPILMGLGRSRLLLKFSLGAATVQLTSILIGIRWGIEGVAISYTLAGFILTVPVSIMQNRVAEIGYARQFRAVAPGVHCALWCAMVYSAIGTTDVSASATLVWGLLAGVVVWVAVVGVFHRAAAAAIVSTMRAVIGRKNRQVIRQ